MKRRNRSVAAAGLVGLQSCPMPKHSFTHPLTQDRPALPTRGLANTSASTREGVKRRFGSRAGLLRTSALGPTVLVCLNALRLAHSPCPTLLLHCLASLASSPNDRMLVNVCPSYFLSICHTKPRLLCNGNNAEHEDRQHSCFCRSRKSSNEPAPLLPLLLAVTGTPASPRRTAGVC